MWRVHVSIFSNGECWYLVQRWSVNHELSSSDIKKITIIIIAQKPLARAPSAVRKQKATSVLVFTGTSGDICRQGDPSVAKALVTYKGRGFLQAGRDRCEDAMDVPRLWLTIRYWFLFLHVYISDVRSKRNYFQED